MQQLHGHELLAPDDASATTAALHPLLVPLTHCRESAAVQGLLRMPPSVALGGDFRWALVEAPLAGGGGDVHHYRLLAQDVAMHVNRIAAQTDAAAQPTADAAAVAAAMEEARARGEDVYIYAGGEAPAGGGEEGVDKQLRAFLLTKVGMFPVRSHARPYPQPPHPHPDPAHQKARKTDREWGGCAGVQRTCCSSSRRSTSSAATSRPRRLPRPARPTRTSDGAPATGIRPSSWRTRPSLPVRCTAAICLPWAGDQ
eukprot:COSAG04_NODE_1055_length_8548_cov_3.532970_5_plen_256_part_00